MVSVTVPFPFPFPFPPVPANPECDVWDDHTFAGPAAPSEEPRADMLIKSGRAPGGVGVDVGG